MKDNINRIKKILRRNPHVVYAYLFGSRSEDSATIGSDWDIAVHFDKKALSGWTRFYVEAELERELGENVHITVLNAVEEPVFLLEVVTKGMVLIDRKPSDRFLFETFVMRQYRDWDYYLQRHMLSAH